MGGHSTAHRMGNELFESLIMENQIRSSVFETDIEALARMLRPYLPTFKEGIVGRSCYEPIALLQYVVAELKDGRQAFVPVQVDDKNQLIQTLQNRIDRLKFEVKLAWEETSPQQCLRCQSSLENKNAVLDFIDYCYDVRPFVSRDWVVFFEFVRQAIDEKIQSLTKS